MCTWLKWWITGNKGEIKAERVCLYTPLEVAVTLGRAARERREVPTGLKAWPPEHLGPSVRPSAACAQLLLLSSDPRVSRETGHGSPW